MMFASFWGASLPAWTRPHSWLTASLPRSCPTERNEMPRRRRWTSSTMRVEIAKRAVREGTGCLRKPGERSCPLRRFIPWRFWCRAPATSRHSAAPTAERGRRVPTAKASLPCPPPEVLPRAAIAQPCTNSGIARNATERALNRSRQGVEAIAEQVRRMAPAIDVHVSECRIRCDRRPQHHQRNHHRYARGAARGERRLCVTGDSRCSVSGARRPGFRIARLAMVDLCRGTRAFTRRRRGRRGHWRGLASSASSLAPWDPWTAVVDACEERANLGLPPARRAIGLEGDRQAIEAGLAAPCGGVPSRWRRLCDRVRSRGRGNVARLPRRSSSGRRRHSRRRGRAIASGSDAFAHARRCSSRLSLETATLN